MPDLEQFQRARLLSALLLGMMALDLLLGPMIVRSVNPTIRLWQNPFFYLVVLEFLAFLIGYFLSRAGRFQLSTGLVIGTVWFIPLTGTLAAPAVASLHLTAACLIVTVLLAVC